MLSTIHIAPDLRIGMARLAGDVTGTDIAHASVSLYESDQWEPGFDEIWDLTGIEMLDVSPSEMRAIVGYEKQESHRVGTGRVTMVVTREVVEMLCVLYRHLIADTGREVKLVRTLEGAAAWLGLNDVPTWFALVGTAPVDRS